MSDEIENELRRHFDAHLPGMVERTKRVSVHSMLPSQYFSLASTQCHSAYVRGDFISAISVTQSVAEGIAKFIAEKHGLQFTVKQMARIRALQKAGIITPGLFFAFKTI